MDCTSIPMLFKCLRILNCCRGSLFIFSSINFYLILDGSEVLFMLVFMYHQVIPHVGNFGLRILRGCINSEAKMSSLLFLLAPLLVYLVLFLFRLHSCYLMSNRDRLLGVETKRGYATRKQPNTHRWELFGAPGMPRSQRIGGFYLRGHGNSMINSISSIRSINRIKRILRNSRIGRIRRHKEQ